MRGHQACILVSLALLSCLVGSIVSGQISNKVEQNKPQEILFSSQYPGGKLDLSLANEAAASIRRGLDWLAAHQQADGSWSNTNFPALTALALWAFADAEYPNKEKIVNKAKNFILSCVQTDGGIYRNAEGKGGGLSSYNTAICMTALHAVGDRSLIPVIQRARKFVAGTQHLGDDIYYGGMGYDRATGKPYADGINTLVATEAMRLTQDVEDERAAGEKRADLDWDATRKFLAGLHNTAESGDENAGGFKYRPDESKAGTTTNKAGVVVFRSYGSMTYAGLLGLIYADVKRDDPRIQSAFQWARKNWSLDENPGMGEEGLYFFYNVLTKALATYGQEMISLEGGGSVAWRSEVVKKLVSLQKTETNGQGYWVNENNRYWESDPVLTSAYSLLALEVAASR